MSVYSELQDYWDNLNHEADQKARVHNASIPTDAKLCETHDFYLPGMDGVKKCRRCQYWCASVYLGNSIIVYPWERAL